MKSRLFLLGILATSTGALAQNGDREGHVMTPPPAHWDIPAAPVVSPEKALDSFTVEDGFEIELVAAEPMIHDPVAVAFDGNGRMWVAEMQGYMPDIDGKGEDETYGRISVLEDTDGDGRSDKHTVFLEDYLLPRAVALVDADRTLLFADNEKLYEAEILIDEKGEISAGKVTVVDETYAEGGNPEHKPNGLAYGLDNWLYNAKSDTRYRKINGQWIKEKTEDRGQWGIKQDNYGRLLTNTNSNFITVEEVPPGTTVRNPHHQFRATTKSGMKDQSVWPVRITPGVNRGYMEGTLDKDGYLNKPTAASGLAVYRGDQFPEEFRGNLFLPEPSGNLVKRATMTEQKDGTRVVESATRDSEFLASTDERFRPVDAFTAPDGSLYLIDFYRGIIQHRVYMTSYLRAQVEERGLDLPIGLGRIWRVTHREGKALSPAPNMQQEDAVALVAHLEKENGWWRDTAQRIIVERGDEKAVPALRALVEASENHLARIHALWTLEGLGALDASLLRMAFADENPRVAAEAIRAAGSLAGTEKGREIFPLLSDLSGSDNLFVGRQLAAILGLFGEAAVPVLAEILVAAPDDTLLADLAVSGLSGRELALFGKLPEGHPLRVPLVKTIVRRNQSAELEQLLAAMSTPAGYAAFAESVVAARRVEPSRELTRRIAAVETPKEIRSAIAKGMVQGGKDKKFKPMPVKELAMLDGVESVEGIDAKDLGRVAALFKIGSGEEDNFLVTDAHRKQFELGRTHYQRICMGCHQIHGEGQQYLAPPLVGAEWVLGSPKRLIALVMDGVEGPIEVLGKTYTAPEIQPLMPGLRTNPEFTDEQLAAIMTYVRNEWGNAATPISTEMVTRYRESTEVRAPWPAAELWKKK